MEGCKLFDSDDGNILHKNMIYISLEFLSFLECTVISLTCDIDDFLHVFGFDFGVDFSDDRFET